MCLVTLNKYSNIRFSPAYESSIYDRMHSSVVDLGYGEDGCKPVASKLSLPSK